MLAHTTLAWSMKCFGYVYYAGIKGEVSWTFYQCVTWMSNLVGAVFTKMLNSKKPATYRLVVFFDITRLFKWATQPIRACTTPGSYGLVQRISLPAWSPACEHAASKDGNRPRYLISDGYLIH